MAIKIIETSAAAPLSEREIGLLRATVAELGRATLLVPSYDEVELQRKVLARAGVGLGIDVCTPASWIAALWELLGTGEHIATELERRLLMAQTVAGFDAAELEPLEPNAGTVRVLGSMARDLSPYIDMPGDLAEGSEGGFRRVVASVVGAYRSSLAERGLLELSEAADRLSRMIPAGGLPSTRGVHVRDVLEIPAYLLRLLAAADAAGGPVSVLLASGQESFADELARACADLGTESSRERLGGAPDGDGDDSPGAPAPVSGAAAMPDFLEVAGPHAHASAYADEIERLACTASPDGAGKGAPVRVIVAAARPVELLDALMPHLAARGIAATAVRFVRFCETEAGRHLAALMDLDRRMAADEAGEGSKSLWWPAPELSDWLACPLSGMDAFQARKFDKYARSRRDATPETIASRLQSLASERTARVGGEGPFAEVPVIGAQVFADIRRGRILPALKGMLSVAETAPAFAFGKQDGGVRQQQEVRVLRRVVDVLENLAPGLGVSRDVAMTVLDGVGAFVNMAGSCEDEPRGVAAFMTLGQAALEPAISAAGILLADADVESYPLSRESGPLVSLARALGRPTVSIEPAGRLRCMTARALFTAPRAVLARVTHTRQAKDRYPAAVWTELAERRRLREGLEDDDSSFMRRVGEDDFAADFDFCRLAGASVERVECSPPCELGPAAVPYLELKRLDPATGELRPRPFSASQLESYASCPLCWFMGFRVKPRSLDAGFGDMQMGNLVHDVLHDFFVERLRSGGTLVNEENLEEALEDLRRVFEAVRDRHARGKTEGSAPVIPHSHVERAQVAAVLPQLEDVIRFEATWSTPYVPSKFEHSFNDLGAVYAGRPFGGRIDRVDTTDDGRALVVDYKHRRRSPQFRVDDPTLGQGGAGDDPRWLPALTQTLIYAQILRRELGLDVRGALYFITKQVPSLAGAVSAELVDDGSGSVPLPGVRTGFPAAPGGMTFEELLDRVEAGISARLDELEEGVVAPSEEPARSCAFNHPFALERRRS